MNIEMQKELIKKHEGFRDAVYEDSVGVKTIGYGHALHTGSKMPREALNLIFDYDFNVAQREVGRLLKEFNISLANPVRRFVLIDMMFNLGYKKLRGFHNMINELQKEEPDFEKVAAEMLDSRWAVQVKGRASHLAELMIRGKY